MSNQLTQSKSNTEKLDRNSWRTPPWLFAWLDSIHNFTVDVCSDDHNHLTKLYLTKDDDSLSVDWHNLIATQSTARRPSFSVFCNPPYSRGMKEKFFAKAFGEMLKGVKTVFVVPSLPSEGWYPYQTATEVTFITGGRVNFHHPETDLPMNGAPAGTCIIVFDPEQSGFNTRHIDRDSVKKRFTL